VVGAGGSAQRPWEITLFGTHAMTRLHDSDTDNTTCLQLAQNGIYYLIRFARASEIWGQSLSFPYDIVHCRVYAIRSILVSKVTKHQSGRSYRG